MHLLSMCRLRVRDILSLMSSKRTLLMYMLCYFLLSCWRNDNIYVVFSLQDILMKFLYLGK